MLEKILEIKGIVLEFYCIAVFGFTVWGLQTPSTCKHNITIIILTRFIKPVKIYFIISILLLKLIVEETFGY